MPPADEERSRSRVYTLLGNLLAAPPDAGLLEELAAVRPEPADRSLLAASWKMLGEAAARTTPADVRDEYQSLFIGLGRGEIVPFGSWYLTGFLMEQPLARLRSDLAELGIERQEGVKEPEDHAGALCDAMAIMIAGDDPVPLERQARFFAQHLEPWMERFFRELQKADSARFYRAVGLLGEQFVEIERQAFGMAFPAAAADTRNGRRRAPAQTEDPEK